MPQARLPESSEGYFVRYHTNGGEALADYKISNSSTVTLTADMLPAPEKDGYYFAGWYTTVDFRNGTKVEEGDTVSMGFNYLDLYAKWMQGIPGQISRITNAVNDIKAAIEEKSGTVPDDAQVDDLADIIRNISTGSSEAKVFAGAIDPGDLTEAQMEEMGLGVGDVYIYVPGME